MSRSIHGSMDHGMRRIPGLGLHLAQVGLGTFRPSALSDATGFQLLDRFVELGGDIVDTAAMYGHGESERVIGRWMRSSGGRESIVLVVKGGYPDKDGTSRISPDMLGRELEGSLERLGTDHVDVFMPHTDDPTVPAGEIVDCLDDMVRAGLALAIGASNWTTERLGEAAVYAALHGKTSFACSSVQWSLAERVSPYLPINVGARNAASSSWYARTRLPVLAWSSLAAGFLGQDHNTCSKAHSQGPYDSPVNRQRRRRAADLGLELGYSAAQVALAWVMRQEAKPFVLIGPGSIEHLAELWNASGLVLSSEQLAWLDDGARV